LYFIFQGYSFFNIYLNNAYGGEPISFVSKFSESISKMDAFPTLHICIWIMSVYHCSYGRW